MAPPYRATRVAFNELVVERCSSTACPPLHASSLRYHLPQLPVSRSAPLAVQLAAMASSRGKDFSLSIPPVHPRLY